MIFIPGEYPAGAGPGREWAFADDLPTPGQLYLIDNAKRNAALGEDITNLQRAEAGRLGLLEEDLWISDSRLVARLNFDSGDQLVDVELVTEPVEVVRCCW
ncbi:DUF6879 family protein [Streptomyces sp. NPDC093149]|uniref:DUF6879 family protein n=1 Tax=Streptomyces sp. NPDC093149 TaxID=3366031 RepID=UPI003800BF15